MTTARDICFSALEELMYYDPGHDPVAEDAATALRYLNRMMAGWALDGVMINFPTVTVWRGPWLITTNYAVGDGVNVGGREFVCILAHAATTDDEPGRSINTATYWTEYTFTDLTFTSTFPMGNAFLEGVISMLTVRIAPAFNMKPDPLTIQRATEGWGRISAQYMRTPAVTYDPALTRLPSRRWPYATSSTIEG